MAINVSAWSIRNPVPATLLFALLTLAGLFAFRGATVQHFPDVDLPMVVVTASLPGTAPAQMETEVARRLENAMATMTGLRHLHTTVQDGVATIAAEFRLEKDPQQALDDTRAAVACAATCRPRCATRWCAGSSSRTRRSSPTPWPRSASTRRRCRGWWTTCHPAPAGGAGVGAVRRIGGVDRQVRWNWIPTSCWRCGWARPTSRAAAAIAARGAGRPCPAGRRRAGGAHAGRGAVGALRALELRCPTGGSRLDRNDHGHRRPRRAQRRVPRRASGGGFPEVRAIGAGDLAVADGVREALDRLAASARSWRSPRRSTPSIRCARTTAAACRCCSRARCWRCWWWACSCATCAPPWSARWRCRCRSCRPSC